MTNQWEEAEREVMRFNSLARQAYDIMMRTGLYPQKFGDKWGATVRLCQHVVADDPFTAVIKANDWLRDNPESK